MNMATITKRRWHHDQFKSSRTRTPWDMTLGDFKKMGGLTDQDIKLLQSEQN